jgi:hypothetical protein
MAAQEQEQQRKDEIHELLIKYVDAMLIVDDDIVTKKRKLEELLESCSEKKYDEESKIVQLITRIKKELSAITCCSLQIDLAESKRLLQIESAELERLRRICSIYDGSYFAAIDKLWKASTRNEHLTEHKTVSFVRTENIDTEQYTTTLDLAKLESTIPAYDALRTASELSNGSSSSSSSSSRYRSIDNNIYDIFGVNSLAYTAHLLPLSPFCSMFWFIFVPCVLNIEDEKTFVTASVSEKGTSMSSTSATSTAITNLKFLQKCIHGSKTMPGERNEQMVGMKHFSTNRIRIFQKMFLDEYPCVLIIPILTHEQVIGWKGDGYDAIVLAGDWADFGITADHVYSGMSYVKKNEVETLPFASEIECEEARALLEQMILYVCMELLNSSYAYDFVRTNVTDDLPEGTSNNKRERIQRVQQIHIDMWKSAIDEIATNGVPVPKSVPIPSGSSWDDTMHVRKISFAKSVISKEYTGTEGMHPAPDPILLLAKAASTWMIRERLYILPGRNDYDLDYSLASDIYSEYSVSTADRPAEEINIDINGDTEVASLSDNEHISE